MQRIKLSLTLVFSGLILLLVARMLADITSFKLGKLATGAGTVASVQKGGPQPQVATTLQSHGVILEKGLFGPATRGALTLLAQQQPVNLQTTSASDLILLGTAAGSPRSSFVLVRRTSSNEERVFRLGEKVFDLGVLWVVRKETAELRSGNQTITLRTPAAPTDADKPTPAGQPAAGVIPAAGGSAGIIDQRALHEALNNIGQTMTDARLLPSMKDGKVEGFRLSEVKPQGIFNKLGLQNGDVLARINDFPIDSPEKSIQVFMALKGQSRIKLDLIRDGAPSSLLYDIR